MALEMLAYKRYAAVAKYTGDDKYVTIPQMYNNLPVTEIRADAFAHNATIEAVLIPPTLQAIGANAFANCHKLKFVGIISEKNASGKQSVFSGDTILDLDSLPNGGFPVSSLIPPGVQIVESGAFAETAISNIEFQSTILELGDSAFEGCSQLEAVILFSCERLSLGKRTFMNSSLTRFYAPRVRLDMVPEYAFANCTMLKSVLARINAVGTRAFYHCQSLKKLDFPKTLSSVGREAFTGCTQLEGVKQSAKQPPSPEPKTTVRIPDETGQVHLTVALTPPPDKQEEPPVPPQISCAEDSCGDFGDPLFRTTIHFCGKPARTIPSRVKGHWHAVDDTFRFTIQTPNSLSEVILQIPVGAVLTRISPILNYIAENEIPTVLLGKQKDSFYYVYEISPFPASHKKDISLRFLHEMFGRLKRPIPADIKLGEMIPPFTMQTEDELEAYFTICKDKLPAWVIQAYQKNKETIRRRSGYRSDDETKHARRAQELLANIDWLPYMVSVPPAEEVRKILDQSFHGMEPVKVRILEVVEQIRRTNALPAWGILLDGPPGTGKTSVAKAIARIFGMSLIQLDMSSIGEDPDTISGSSRIFTNARAGMLLESMFQNRSSTAILLANEIDKAGAGRSGRCASDVLLSILDKTGFYENFLEEIIPTDNLFCIGTCNDLSKISKPLQDRFLVITIPGYSPSEKRIIFTDYVFPRAQNKSNILPDQMYLNEEAVDLLLSEYALEPGVRDLEQYAERFIGDYCRYSSTKSGKAAQRIYTPEDIRNLFGPGRKTTRHIALNPGQINAAFYHKKKAYFFLIEAAIVPGSGKFKAFGPISKIQEEYCEVAYWCARNTISSSVCDFSKYDVAVFVPQAIPDGADNHVGLACYAAICSKLMNQNLAIDHICFIGGCDMNGSLYFDENDLAPLLQSMKMHGISTLYAPMGTNRLVGTNVSTDCNVMIVEAPDAKTLFTLAVAQSNCTR